MEKNKNKLIKKIIQKLLAHGFQCQQAEEDADRLIVITAITVAKIKKTTSPGFVGIL